MTEPVEWEIRVDNHSVAHVEPGQSLVIGRKPIRPLPQEEGRERLDIVDDTKSVSKRHALFTTDGQGNATVEDLQSTNGTYVVTKTDDLWRIAADMPFDLPQESVRLQLGDVPVEVVPKVRKPAEPEPVSQPMAAVSDLFSYASAIRSEGSQDSQGSRMSVDDILDVRQGEPTHIFHAMKKDSSPFSQIHDRVIKNELNHNVGVATDQSEASSEPDRNSAEPAESEQDPSESRSTQETPAPEQKVPDSTDDPTDDPTDKFRPHPTSSKEDDTQPAPVPSYQPAFEPGSVFDRLSRGEFDRKEDVIESGGFTSEDAKKTREFDDQFAIARHPKLLPFLALNPSLYGDLYAWLEALGNADIDDALRSNKGYQTWKKQEDSH